MKRSLRLPLGCLLFLPCLAAAAWQPIGPPGGDVRSLAVDPRNPQQVYLGTADGILYRSEDRGQSWRRIVPGFPDRGKSLDEIVIDPRGRILVAYWEVAGQGGGIAHSTDGGRSFMRQCGMVGESVRALHMAPGNPDVLVAGTISGVFRTDDAGVSWRRISPAGHPEIRNVESIAIDPLDHETLYAGTWHLPWKTTDGGKTWRKVTAGMIDDSDVFTLNVDRRRRETIYGTACSGIYRSQNAGGLWSKIRGIPSSSRRTRAFLQHPARPEVFFAGTTEGLWRTTDDLKTWQLVTPKDLVVNAVAVLDDGRVLIGTDGGGVLRSEDGGATWASSNEGFSERFVARVVFDPQRERVLAAVREDRQHGGVFSAPSPAGPWTRWSAGLEGREVFSLAQLGPTLFAGTDAGLFRLGAADARWQASPILERGIEVRPRIADVATLPPATVVAATSAGLLLSDEAGVHWKLLGLGLEEAAEAVTISARGEVYAATRLGLYRSKGRGQDFVLVAPVPAGVHRLVMANDSGFLFAATLSGLYRGVAVSPDRIAWHLCRSGLPASDIAAVEVASGGRTILASDFENGGVYRSDDHGETWKPLDASGLRSSRLWTLAADPRHPERLLAGAVTGGLHLFEPAGGGAAAAAR